MRSSLADEAGSASVEYALLGAGIVVVIVIAVGATGSATLALFRAACTAVSHAAGGPAC